MCLIIHRPAGSVAPQAWIDNAIVQNPDGWGIMASDGDRLKIARGLTRKGFGKAMRRYVGMDVFIHFRNATHGDISTENCHPFSVANGQFAIMHNGIIEIDRASRPDRSDTWHYCNSILAPIFAEAPDAIADESFVDSVGGHVGTGNKLAILRADGLSAIVNRDMGDERGGCWLSNTWSISSPWTWTSRGQSYVHDLQDIASMDRDEIEAMCMEDPAGLADAILDHFAGTRSNAQLWDYR